MTPHTRIGYYSICHVTDIAGTDSLNYRTLRWNYDDKLSAMNQLREVAREAGVAADECCVIRWFRSPWDEDYDEEEDD